LLSFLSPLSILYSVVCFLHTIIALFTSFGLNSFLSLFLGPFVMLSFLCSFLLLN
jgi:hypothetical protein